MKSPQNPVLFLIVAMLPVMLACNEEVDFERKAPTRGSFGEEVHRILQKDLERSPEDADRRSQVFVAHRDAFVGAVDATLPDATLDPFDAVMVDMLPVYDSGLMPGMLRKVAEVLGDARANPELLQSLTTSNQRPELLADPTRDRLMPHVLGFEDMGALSTLLADTLLANDTYGPTGPQESDATIRLLTALRLSLAEAEVDSDPDRFAVRLVRVLSTPDPAFRPAASYEELLSVRVDARGLPLVARTDIGALPYPFVDGNNDGLADIDAEQRFISSDPSEAPIVPFGPGGEMVASMRRDDQGRLLNTATGGYAFEYVDLHGTAVGYLMRDAGELAADDVIFDLLRALEVVMGDAEGYSDEYGAWRGYARDSDLVGLITGLLVALDQDDVGTVLAGVEILLRDHPDQLAAVLHAIDDAFDIADADTIADFADDSSLVDDLLPLLLELVETPGLLEDVLLALDDPAARELGSGMAMLMQYKNPFITVTPGGPYDSCFMGCKGSFEIGTVARIQCIRACPNSEIFAQPMDHSAPESPENRSLFERVQALMWESAGTRYEVSIERMVVLGANFSGTAQALGPAMIFPDIAEQYLQTLTGDMHLVDMVNPEVTQLASPLGLGNGSVVGIVTWIMANLLELEMDESPTTDQVTRFFNLSPLQSTDPDIEMEMSMSVCRSGHLCIDAHADTLFAIEAAGVADSMKPIAEAFTRHGKTSLLPRMFAVLYAHYPAVGTTYAGADGMPLPLSPSNLRSIEPVLIQVMENRLLLDSLGDIGTITAGIQTAEGMPMVPALENQLRFLLTPDPTLTLVDGATSTVDPRGNAVPVLSPVYLILDPLRGISDRLDAEPEAQEQWDRAVEGLIDVMLATEESMGTVRFAKAGGAVLAALAIRELRDVWQVRQTAGTRSTWLRDELAADVGDLVAGRGLRAAVQVFAHIDATEGGADLLRNAAMHLFEVDGTVAEHLTLATYLLLAGALDSPVWVPLAHFLADVVDPTRVWNVEGFPEYAIVVHALSVLDEASAVDPDEVVLGILAGGLEPVQPDGTTNLGVIWEVVRQVNRVEPGSDAPMTAEDYAAVFAITEAFLLDQERGAERLYDQIEFAIHGPDGKPETP